MRSTYKQLYYINRRKIKADGTTAIMCRVTIDGKATVLATGLYCTPDEWNSKKGETKNSRINGMLNDYKNRIDDTCNMYFGISETPVMAFFSNSAVITPFTFNRLL